MEMRVKGIAFLLAGMMVLSMTGCASNPENSAVKGKNLDKMLEKAENTEEGAVSYEDVVKEVAGSFETYQTQIKDDALKVTVDVNARVEIPEVEQLSIYRVSQKKISQDFLDKVRTTLTPEVTYYEGRILQLNTKADVAKEIQYWKEEIDNLKVGENGIGDEEALQEYKQEYQRMLAEEEAAYEKAPDVVDLADYPSDNQIHSMQELYDSNPGDSFYEWAYSLHSDGEIYYGVSDGKDGDYQTLYAQNCENYGNCLRYAKGKNDYSTTIYFADVEDDLPYTVAKKEGETPDFSGTLADGMQCHEVDNEPVTLSEKEARKQTDMLLEKLELTDYACYDSGLYSEIINVNDDESKYRDIYKFIYMRKLDGIFVDNQAGFKLVDEWSKDGYTKKMWSSEAVVIAVNDSGIVGFRYLTPLSIDETVVEKTSIQSFNDIKDTFEQMVVIENATEEGNVTIDVTDVSLVYTRISEKDSFDTGLVVPVWDFEGKIVDEYGREKTGNILSINAIDGTVINRELGY